MIPKELRLLYGTMVAEFYLWCSWFPGRKDT